MRPLACLVGFHAWHPVAESKDMLLIQCLRCGRTESQAPNVALRLGYDNYLNSH